MAEVDWLERWQDNRIGFHQEKINSRLIRFWPSLELQAGSTVFVPLCGKTLDMVWLQDQGHQVIGSELSDIACRDFFAENQLDFSQNAAGKLTCYNGEQISLLQGDIFDITPEMLSSATSVFDRAALVALPKDIRATYASHLAEVLPQRTKILLISMEYDQEKMSGPPFSVSEEEVRDLFSPFFSVDLLSHSSGPDIVGNLKERGLNSLDEKVFLIHRS